MCLTPFFQGWFGLISYMIVMKEFISLTTVAVETGKIRLSVIVATVGKKKNDSSKTRILHIPPTTEKIN